MYSSFLKIVCVSNYLFLSLMNKVILLYYVSTWCSFLLNYWIKPWYNKLIFSTTTKINTCAHVKIYVQNDSRNCWDDGHQYFPSTFFKFTWESYLSYFIPCSPLVKFRITLIFFPQLSSMNLEIMRYSTVSTIIEIKLVNVQPLLWI